MMKRLVYRLEAFEWIGLFATIVAAVIFFVYAHALDRLVGESNYHWHIVGEIVGIYARFIPYAVLFGALVIFGVSMIMRRRSKEALLRFTFGLRVFLAYCLLLIVFRVVNFYVPVLHPGIDDSVIQKADHFIFGNQVSYILEPLANHFLTDVLTGAYVSWFWLLFATIALMLLKSREAASEYILATLIAFYVGYIFYVIVPVIGPGYTLHYGVNLGDIAPTFTENRLEISRDCFPSLHTATSVLMVIYVARFARKWLMAYIPMAILIIFATLYLRIHYGTDDLAGILLAILVSLSVPHLHRWWERHRQRDINGESGYEPTDFGTGISSEG